MNILLYLLLLIFGFSTTVPAQGNSNPEVQLFTPSMYQAAPLNREATQDLRGVMYFANQDGVLEFDGQSWHLIKLPNYSGVRSIATNVDGRVYVGGTGELGYLSPDERGVMQYVSLKPQLAERDRDFTQEVIKIYVIADGLIFLTEKRVFIYNVIDQYFNTIETQTYFYESVYNKRDLYLFEGERGLVKLVNNELESIPGGDFFRAYQMLPYGDYKLLIITRSNGLWVYDPGSPTEKKQQQESTKFEEYFLGQKAELLDPSVLLEKMPPEGPSLSARGDFTPIAYRNLEFYKSIVVASSLALNENQFLLNTIQKGTFIIDHNGEILFHFKKAELLNNHDAFHVYNDYNGNLWFSLSHGIALITASQLQKFNIRTINFESTDRLFNVLIRRVERSKDDTLIFSGALFKKRGGIQSVEESELTYQKLAFADNALRFIFTSTYYDVKEPVQFQTYLDGFDTEWSKWSDRTYREFTNLYWGDYVFHVRAKKADGRISRVSDFSFKIKPPWYESWYFYVAQLGFLSLLVVIAGILRGLGVSDKVSNKLSGIVVAVIFSYFNTQVGLYSLIATFASGIVFFKIFFSVVMGVFMSPAQGYLNTKLSKFRITIPKIGQILVKQGELDPDVLQGALDLQNRKTGQLLIDQGLLTRSALKKALLFKETPVEVLLVEQGLVQQGDIDKWIKKQKQPIGQILVDQGLIDRDVLWKALAEQRNPKPIGETLVEQGHVSQEHVNLALKKQHRWVSVARFFFKRKDKPSA
ncbi:triple tyrosine motif-containing protein [Deltaproteobacteria bacterium TL4]